MLSLGQEQCKTRYALTVVSISHATIPWVPEVSRGPLRDLPAEGQPMSTGNHARQTSGTQGNATKLYRLNWPLVAKISLSNFTSLLSFSKLLPPAVSTGFR